MASGRVLVVHDSGATRALLTELLSRENLLVETADSTYEAVSHVIDDPVEVVLLGLGGLDESELEVIDTLKSEEDPPRIIVTFPTPRRDLAVRALTRGADGYLLEPFYADELLGIVRGQLGPRGPAVPSAALTRLAREVAHAINNPLQVLTLLLQKERVTKKELMDAVPDQVARIEKVVKLLRDFGALETPGLEDRDPLPLFQAALAEGEVEGEAEEPPPNVRVDPRLYTEALGLLFEAVRLRCGAEARLNARLVVERDAVAVRLGVPARPFAEEGAATMLEAVFVVRPDRGVMPGLARARALLESMDGSLNVHPHDERLIFVARVPISG